MSEPQTCPQHKAPKVFISYSHDSPEHRVSVLALSERLRTDGIDSSLDQYVNGTPHEGWPRWMLNQLDWADFVLAICTETYYRRFRGHGIPGKGKGVDWEGMLITQEAYEARSVNVKFVPVLFATSAQPWIPEPLRGSSYYLLDSELAYQTLKSLLSGSIGVQPVTLGDYKPSARKQGTPATFPAAANSIPTQCSGASGEPLTSKSAGQSSLAEEAKTPLAIRISEVHQEESPGGVGVNSGSLNQVFGQMINTQGGAYVAGTVNTGGARFVGRDDHSQNTVTHGASPEEFGVLLRDLRELLGRGAWDEDTKEIAHRDLAEIEKQTAKPTPKLSVIAAKLSGLKALVENATGLGTAAIGLSQMLQRGIEIAQHLFR